MLITIVICASGLGFYALHTANRTVTGLLGVSGTVIAGIPEWQQHLPPLLAECLNDHRAPDYRGEIDVSAKLIKTSKSKDAVTTVVTVENRGSETITLLALIVTLDDADGVPCAERRVYAATPIAIDEDDWRGPLMPAETRKFLVRNYRYPGTMSAEECAASVNVADIRVWNGPAEEAVKEFAQKTP